MADLNSISAIRISHVIKSYINLYPYGKPFAHVNNTTVKLNTLCLN